MKVVNAGCASTTEVNFIALANNMLAGGLSELAAQAEDMGLSEDQFLHSLYEVLMNLALYYRNCREGGDFDAAVEYGHQWLEATKEFLPPELKAQMNANVAAFMAKGRVQQ